MSHFRSISAFQRPISLILLLLMAISPAAAQYTTASFSGSVVDASGATLPDSKVTIRNVDTALTQTLTTGTTGAFLFSSLPIGNYELRVEHAGFFAYVQTGITLAVNQAATQTVVMRVGQLTESVTVEANADLVVTQTGTVSQLVDQKRIVELPLNGRMAQTLVFVSAGTVDLGRNGCRARYLIVTGGSGGMAKKG